MKRSLDQKVQKSQTETLLKWVQEDSKLCDILKRIVSFDRYKDDHSSWGEHCKLEQILVVRREALKDGHWVPFLRKEGVNNGTHDNSWCCPFPTMCKNSLYIADNELHLSTWATGMLLTREEIQTLRKNQELIQEERGYKYDQEGQLMVDENDNLVLSTANRRESHLLLKLEQCRTCIGLHEFDVAAVYMKKMRTMNKDTKKDRAEMWPAITYEFVGNNNSASIERLIPESQNVADLINAMLNEDEHGTLDDLNDLDDSWFVKCPPLNIACKLTDRSEVKHLLRRIFTEHFKVDLAWTWDDLRRKKHNFDFDTLLEVLGWNQAKKKKCEEDYNKDVLERKSVYDDVPSFTIRDKIVFCKQSSKCAENVFYTSASNYSQFFSLVNRHVLQNWNKLGFSHALPIPRGIVTSSSYYKSDYESSTQRWSSLHSFISAAREHVLLSEEMKVQGVTREALEFQVRKDLLMWVLSACAAIADEHPSLREVLLASHEATLLSKSKDGDDQVVMKAWEQLRANIRFNLYLRKQQKNK